MTENVDFIAGAEAMRKAIIESIKECMCNCDPRHDGGLRVGYGLAIECVTDEPVPHQPPAEPKAGATRVIKQMIVDHDGNLGALANDGTTWW